MSKHITVDIDRCVGCHTCELECAIAHSESKQIELIMIRGERVHYRINVEAVRGVAVPMNCQQCEEPACELACPTGAVKRLAPGKPVLVDDERCIGCSMCVQACPFGMISMRSDGKSSYKCDLCITRAAVGKGPACVASCPTKALKFEEEESSNREKRLGAAERLLEAQHGAMAQALT